MSSILVHGGAGARADDDDPEAAKEGCLAAARVGKAILDAGGSAVDAVVAAVAALEDNPRFNAGTGSALNALGEVETDASVMRGEDGGAGAVAALKDVLNPIRLARLVMEKTPHVLLAGAGARAFAVEQGVPLGSLVTPRAQARFEKAAKGHGTVGAVARDKWGHLAAATSTGGTPGKMPGRIGDSPIIGAGTFADDALGACSCTGTGEAILKATLARKAVDLCLMVTPNVAAAEAVKQLARFGGDGGLILIDPTGRLGFAFDTQRMARAWVDEKGVEGAGY